MPHPHKIFLLLIALISFQLLASDKVVYGDDNRRDFFDISNQNYLEQTGAIAAMISDTHFLNHTETTFKLLDKKMKLCLGEKFRGQHFNASCSGFLVDFKNEQYLVTAGHCVERIEDCEIYSWVFNYQYSTSDIAEDFIINKNDIYKCKEIIEQKYDKKSDYAVVKLDRRVEQHRGLRIRQEGRISKWDVIYTIGFPTGLPLKITDDAYVRDNSKKHHFTTNLDTFAGNSGSAVFNSITNKVEGILVRGEQDYEWGYQNGEYCAVPKNCEMDACIGEDVSRIGDINFFKK